MICWPGDSMHEGIRRYLSGMTREVVEEMDRCVNEGAEGCTVRADESGWCPACWSTNRAGAVTWAPGAVPMTQRRRGSSLSTGVSGLAGDELVINAGNAAALLPAWPPEVDSEHAGTSSNG